MFNEAEKYLVQNWQVACRVKRSMREIRTKYTAIENRVMAALPDQYGELDWSGNCLATDGRIAVGREGWSQSHPQARGWIGIEYLDLESLSDENAEQPFIGIYTGTHNHPATNIEAIKRFFAAVGELLTEDEIARWVKDEPSEYEDESDYEYQYVLWYDLPEDRKDLMAMLLEGNHQRFVDCLMEHLGHFAKFIPPLDDLFS